MDFLEITLAMLFVAVSCAICGTFLLLRRMILITDAISHVLLFGIAATYLIIQDLSSPLLLVGAAGSALLTVYLVEWLQTTGRIKQDAAIGLVFPALFALGTIMVSMFMRDTHLDIDRVLLGSAEFIPSYRVIIQGTDVGPYAVWTIGFTCALVMTLTLVFHKELKLTTFDPALAATLGLSPALVYHGLMTTVSITTVICFDATGPILVIAYFVVPPACAFLYAKSLVQMLAISVLTAIVCTIVGVLVAFALNTNIAGTSSSVMASLFGLLFIGRIIKDRN